MMEGAFDGFSPKAMDWFLGIALHNDKDYFAQNRPLYEELVRGPFIAYLNELANEFGGTPKVFRIHRDVRFAADKRPYKTNVSGYLGNANGGPVWYVDLSAEGLFAATGYYGMAPDQLARYRHALTEHEDSAHLGEALRKIVERDGVEGECLKTAPRGFDKDAPNADLLRFKWLTVSERIPFEQVTRDSALAHAREVWHRGDALNAWLGEHVGPSQIVRSR